MVLFLDECIIIERKKILLLFFFTQSFGFQIILKISFLIIIYRTYYLSRISSNYHSVWYRLRHDAPAATIAPSPIVTPGIICACAPIYAQSLITTLPNESKSFTCRLITFPPPWMYGNPSSELNIITYCN